MENIATIAGRKAMAYMGETPWHRLGQVMTGAPTVEEAMAAASLDWTVDLRPSYFRKADGSLSLMDRIAVVRTSDDQLLGDVGSDYTVLQNSEAFGVLSAAIEEHGLVIETAGALGKGERVWMLARVPASIEPVPGDRVDGYALVVSGHDGKTTHVCIPTCTRVVCQNTLNMALSAAGRGAIFRFRHVRTAKEQLEQAGLMVTNLVGTLKATGTSFAQLATKKLTPSQTEAYIDAALGIPSGTELSGMLQRKRQAVLDLVSFGRGAEFAPGSAWAAFNAITEYIDHARTQQAARTLRSADESAAIGRNAKVKAEALDLALAMVA